MHCHVSSFSFSFYFSLDKVSLCSFPCLDLELLYQAGLKSICLHFPNAGIKGATMSNYWHISVIPRPRKWRQNFESSKPGQGLAKRLSKERRQPECIPRILTRREAILTRCLLTCTEIHKHTLSDKFKIYKNKSSLGYVVVSH